MVVLFDPVTVDEDEVVNPADDMAMGNVEGDEDVIVVSDEDDVFKNCFEADEINEDNSNCWLRGIPDEDVVIVDTGIRFTVDD